MVIHSNLKPEHIVNTSLFIFLLVLIIITNFAIK
jgi:hypothetical protein